MMLIIQIALGIALGIFIIKNFEKLIGLVAILFSLCLFSIILISAYIFISDNSKALTDAAIILTTLSAFICSIMGAGFLISKNLKATYEEAAASIFVIVIIAAGTYSAWDEYTRYGSTNINLSWAAPCLIILLLCFGELTRRIHRRYKASMAHEA